MSSAIMGFVDYGAALDRSKWFKAIDPQTFVVVCRNQRHRLRMQIASKRPRSEKVARCLPKTDISKPRCHDALPGARIWRTQFAARYPLKL
jgi:hypothetical protein